MVAEQLEIHFPQMAYAFVKWFKTSEIYLGEREYDTNLNSLKERLARSFSFSQKQTYAGERNLKG